MLFNYLIKEKRRSIHHLSTEWDSRKEFNEKNIDELLLTYPNVFKRVKVKSRGKFIPGVGLIQNIINE